MEIRAYQKYIRTSPRKLRLVADAVRDLTPRQALDNLKFMKKRAAEDLRKVLKQAVSNAVNNHNLAESALKIKHLDIEEGPRLKRWRAVSRGRGHRILKRMSHVKIILEGEKEGESNKKAVKVAKAVKERKERGKIQNSKP